MFYSLKYTHDVPASFAGYTWLWIIKIRPEYKDDKGLLAHEKTHVWQFWRTCGLHIFLRLLDWYKLKIEVEAYSEQLCWPPANNDPDHYRKIYAGFIATKYGLDITEEEAYKLLN